MEFMDSHRERRLDVKWPVTIEAADGEVFACKTVDITSIGIQIQCEREFQLPAMVEMEIRIDEGSVVQCIARILYECKGPDGLPAYGAMFSYFYGNSRTLLVDAIAEVISEGSDDKDSDESEEEARVAA